MSKELLASKVVVFEEEPRVRGIPSAPTSVAGIVGVTAKGPVSKPTLCTSFDEYESTFGGFMVGSDMALAAMGFFENGGNQLYVSRVLSETAVQATLWLLARDDGAAQILLFTAIAAGASGNELSIQSTLTAGNRFDLSIFDGGVLMETFTNVTRDTEDDRFVETIINDAVSGSKLVNVTSSVNAPGIAPRDDLTTLAGGNDGLGGLTDADFVGDESTKTGIHGLDKVQDLALLLVPGRATSAIHNAMLQYCEVYRDGMVFAILDPPANTSAENMVTYVTDTASLENASEYGAIYWPRVKVLNPSKSVYGSSDQIVVPPSGIIAGVYARTDSARPGGVYDEPAGTETGRMFGVLGFETREVLEERKRDLLYPHRINPLTTEPDLPLFIDGSRTLNESGNFPFIAERRGVIFIERSLKKGLAFARHRNNTADLRAQVRRTITAFLLTQMNNGAFSSNEPSKAFFVDVSDQLNTPSVIAAGKLIARIGLATNKPAEYIVLQISQDTRALDAELAAGG